MEPTFTFSYGTSNAQMTVFFYFEPASQAYVTINIEIVCKMQTNKTKTKIDWLFIIGTIKNIFVKH